METTGVAFLPSADEDGRNQVIPAALRPQLHVRKAPTCMDELLQEGVSVGRACNLSTIKTCEHHDLSRTAASSQVCEQSCCTASVQVIAGCWGGRLLHWEEDPDGDTISEHRQHRSGSGGDVLCIAVQLPGRLAAGEPVLVPGQSLRSRHPDAVADQSACVAGVKHPRVKPRAVARNTVSGRQGHGIL